METENTQGNENSTAVTENSQNTSVASAAKTAATAISSAAKAASGDVAGALLDLAKDENVKRFIAALLIGSILLLMYGSMMMGSALTGTIEGLKQNYVAAYDNIYQDYAISANGSTFAMYSFDHQAAQNQAMSLAIKNAVEGFFKKDSAYANKSLPNDNGTSVNNDDYRATIKAVKEKEAFVGDSGALHQRMEMIKGRVEQRGKQLAYEASLQYELSALGLSVGEYLDSLIKDPILFAGVDLSNSSLDINTSAFEISDIQALKILAAYSVQNDCNIQNIDMWDLMNYCGWYAAASGDLDTVDKTNTIYDTYLAANYGNDIGNVVEAGEALSYKIKKLAPPKVPVWDGSCAAQWYYEEIAQLRKNNEIYDYYQEKNDTEKLAQLTHFEENTNGNIVLSNFEKLSNYDTFGIIDRIYTSASANLIVTRTKYHGADEWYREALANLTGKLRDKWKAAFADVSKQTSGGNTVKQDKNGKHSFTLYPKQTGSYYLYRPSTNWTSATRSGSPGNAITFSGLAANTYYEVYQITGSSNAAASNNYQKIDSFTTTSQRKDYEAYKLQLDVDVTYSARSVDEIIEDVLGLWPGSLAEITADASGQQFADGHDGNELMAKTWTDQYTDQTGTKTISFKRQTGYQAEAYKDYLVAIATALGLDTSGLDGSGYGDGATMVEIAKAEYEYYTANSLFEGGRYWNMVKQATGVKYPDTTPWCACFVMTCAWQLDLLGEGKPWDGVDWIYYCTGLYNELVNSGVASGYSSPGSDYRPEPGDIVFFNETVTSNGLEHVGIVKEVTEKGKLITYEGNKGDRLKECTYSSYRLGTFAYGNCVIAAYCHPTYPATFLENPQYENIINSITASANARIIRSSEGDLFLAGLGRFRWSQMDTVLTALKKNYPELYKADLRTAYDADDMETFVTAWNKIATSSKKDRFKVAQRKLLSQLFVQPMAKLLKDETGFDWRASEVREEILLSIVSTTDQKDACIAVLKALQQNFNNKVTDEQLLEILSTNNRLYNMVSANRNYLWPNDTAAVKNKWCYGIQGLLNKLIKNQHAEAA